MGRWLWMTGGLVLWAVAFSALYGLTSLGDVVGSPDAAGWRTAGLGVSLACALGCVALFGVALRRRASTEAFADDMAALSAGLGLLATLWQAAPNIVGY